MKCAPVSPVRRRSTIYVIRVPKVASDSVNGLTCISSSPYNRSAGGVVTGDCPCEARLPSSSAPMFATQGNLKLASIRLDPVSCWTKSDLLRTHRRSRRGVNVEPDSTEICAGIWGRASHLQGASRPREQAVFRRRPVSTRKSACLVPLDRFFQWAAVLAGSNRGGRRSHGLHAFPVACEDRVGDQPQRDSEGPCWSWSSCSKDVSSSVSLPTWKPRDSGMGAGDVCVFWSNRVSRRRPISGRSSKFSLTGLGHEIEFPLRAGRFYQIGLRPSSPSMARHSICPAGESIHSYRQTFPLIDPSAHRSLHPAPRIWKRRLEGCSRWPPLGDSRLARSQEGRPRVGNPETNTSSSLGRDGRGGVFYHNLEPYTRSPH